MATQSINLDGNTAFSAFGRNFTWSGQRIDRVSIGFDAAVQNNTLNVALTGPEWTVRTMNFFTSPPQFTFDVNITDTNDGVMRRIDTLNLSDNGLSTVTLYNTRVRFIQGDSDAVLNLGSQFVTAIDLFSGTHTVNTSTGDVGLIKLGDGVNTLNAGTGFLIALDFGTGTNTLNGAGSNIGALRSRGTNDFTLSNADAVSLGSGTSTVSINNGFVGSLTSYSGTNTVTIGAAGEVRSIGFSGGVDILDVFGRVEQAVLGGNDDQVTVRVGGRIDQLNVGDGNNTIAWNGNGYGTVTAYDGNDQLTVNFGGRIDQASLGSGDDTVIVNDGQINVLHLGQGNNTATLGTQFTQFVGGYDGNDTVNIRAGGAGAVNLGHGNNTVTTTTGFVDYIQTFNGTDQITIGAGRAKTIDTGSGNDILNLINGRADFIDTGDGNDTVTLGALGTRFIVMGNGDDVLSIARFTPNWGVVAQGDSGVDTLDLIRFNTATTISLATSAFQNVGAPASAPDMPAFGYVSVIQFENVLTGNFNDRVDGSTGNNTINTAGGNDLIFADAGDDLVFGGDQFDTIHGGEGNDTVNGGNGRDLIFLNQGDDLYNDNTQGGVSGRDTVYAGLGNDTIQGGNGDDVFHGEAGNDRIFARLGNDTVYAGDQFDFIDAGDGNDLVFGGKGGDRVFLGNGNDVYVDTAQTGAFGQDTITGGAGVDRFEFQAVMSDDIITDFQVGVDELRLTQSLWGGGLSTAQVVSTYASVTAGGVLFDFGAGQSILLQGLNSTAGLDSDILLA